MKLTHMRTSNSGTLPSPRAGVETSPNSLNLKDSLKAAVSLTTSNKLRLRAEANSPELLLRV
eukprot:525023-Amphidinium_carterae.2